MRDINTKAAGRGNHGRLLATGEAFAVPLEYSSTPPAEKQDAICKRLAADYERARALAIHHAKIADSFLAEAEALSALLKVSEAL